MNNLTLIAAMSLNGVIGNDNMIPWRCSEDLRHFRDTTYDQVVIMGRKTFESLDSRPLKGRVNMVVSGKYTEVPVVTHDEVERTTLWQFNDPDQAVKESRNYKCKKVFVIGGGQLYHRYIDVADRLIISHIHLPFEGDVKFPEIDMDQWMVEKIDHRLKGEVPFTIIHYLRQ